MFGDFFLFLSLHHSKDKDFATATSYGVKISPQHDRVVMRSYTCDLKLGSIIPCRYHTLWYLAVALTFILQNLI